MIKRMSIFAFSLLVILIVFMLFSSKGVSVFIDNKSQIKDEGIRNEVENNHLNNGKDDEMTSEKFKVVIDPGHGGKDNGATSASGKYEKDFTLSVAKKVEKLLNQESHIQVFMTRADDTYLSQESRYRPKYANELGADLFISIHGNTFEDPSVSGTEVFYYHKNSRLLAEILQKYLVDATGFSDRGAKKEELFVLTDTNMPAALIEVGYLTNPEDEAKMWTDDFQDNVAKAIVDGIKEFIDTK